ncbi:MAG: TolC family protein [Verrucomicrobiota bacterium]
MVADEAPLTLEDTLTRVLEANLRLRGARGDHAVAEQRRAAEWSIFEPQLLFSAAREANSRRNTTEQFLRQSVSTFDEDNEVYSAAIESILPTGGTLRLGSQMRGLRNNLQVGQREWDSFTGLTLTQPLLRGAGWGAVAAEIRLATADSEIALQELRGQMALVLSESEFAFWEARAAAELISLREASLRLAQDMLQDNRERVQAGRMVELEVLQAEAGVALRRSGLSEARKRQVDALSRLKAFLARDARQPASLALAGELAGTAPVTESAEGLLAGIHDHPAYRAQRERLEQAGIRVAYAKNQRWPQLDLKASYGLNGLGGDFDQSYDRAFHEDYDSWYVGVEINVPVFGGKRTRHELSAARIRQRQAIDRLAAIEIELSNGVHALVAGVESLRDRVEALESVVAVQENVLRAENDRLLAGQSESRRLLEVEEDLSNARVEALQAQLELRQATAQLLVQQGTCLQARGCELAEARGGKGRR